MSIMPDHQLLPVGGRQAQQVGGHWHHVGHGVHLPLRIPGDA